MHTDTHTNAVHTRELLTKFLHRTGHAKIIRSARLFLHFPYALNFINSFPKQNISSYTYTYTHTNTEHACGVYSIDAIDRGQSVTAADIITYKFSRHFHFRLMLYACERARLAKERVQDEWKYFIFHVRQSSICVSVLLTC